MGTLVQAVHVHNAQAAQNVERGFTITNAVLSCMIEQALDRVSTSSAPHENMTR